MPDFASILAGALTLSPADQVKLIDALWDSVPIDADLPLQPEWAAELDRRTAELQSGTLPTIPWLVRVARRGTCTDRLEESLAENAAAAESGMCGAIRNRSKSP